MPTANNSFKGYPLLGANGVQLNFRIAATLVYALSSGRKAEEIVLSSSFAGEYNLALWPLPAVLSCLCSSVFLWSMGNQRYTLTASGGTISVEEALNVLVGQWCE